jgi:hypothetical protein
LGKDVASVVTLELGVEEAHSARASAGANAKSIAAPAKARIDKVSLARKAVNASISMLLPVLADRAPP